MTSFTGLAAVGMMYVGGVSSPPFPLLTQDLNAGRQSTSLTGQRDVLDRKLSNDSPSEKNRESQPSKYEASFPKPALALPASLHGSETVDIPSLIAVTERVSTDFQEDNKSPDQLYEEQATESASLPDPIIGTANHIEVPSINIDIAVLPGVYDVQTQTWTVDDSAAFHASTTVPVNDTNGTTLLYGHAKWGIFGNLPDIQSGAEAIVYTEEGLKFIYTLEEVYQVEPADMSMITTQGEPKLLLQTCTGFFDQYRILASFSLREIVEP